MHKIRVRTGDRDECVYPTSLGFVAYNPLEAEVTKTVKSFLFKGEAHPGYVKVTSPLSVCEKLSPEQAREIASSLEALADKAESLPEYLEDRNQQEESGSADTSERDGSAGSPEEPERFVTGRVF